MRKVFIIFITFILVFLLSSCKKCNKEEYKYYIIEQYNKNINYVNKVIDSFREIGNEFGLNLENEIENPKIISSDDKDLVRIEFNIGVGVLMESPKFYSFNTNQIIEATCKESDDFSWNYYSTDHYLFEKQVVSYAIIYGEPLINENLSYYDHTLIDNKIYLAGKTLDCDNFIKTLNIPDNITNVLGYAFYFDIYINEIYCNANLETIHRKAFVGCIDLKYVKFNEGLERIGAEAFKECINLEYIVIPESVKEMGCEVFISGNIFCEAEYKPFDWRDNWATKNAKVYWKGEWEYNSEGIPVPISE